MIILCVTYGDVRYKREVRVSRDSPAANVEVVGGRLVLRCRRDPVDIE